MSEEIMRALGRLEGGQEAIHSVLKEIKANDERQWEVIRNNTRSVGDVKVTKARIYVIVAGISGAISFLLGKYT